MTIADNLQTLINCKADMKSAIEERGVTVSGGLSTYADAIRQIEGSDVSIEGFDWWFPNGTKFGGSKFETAPLFDTSNFKSFKYMFEDCQNLISILSYNTSNVTDFQGAFQNCPNLENVGLLDFSNAEKTTGMVFDSTNLKNLSGFINYGKKEANPRLDLSDATLLTHESIMNVINYLYDRNKDNLSEGKLLLSYELRNQISDEEKAIATNKGWVVL